MLQAREMKIISCAQNASKLMNYLQVRRMEINILIQLTIDLNYPVDRVRPHHGSPSVSLAGHLAET